MKCKKGSKVVSVLLSAVLLLGLGGCQPNGTSETPGTTGTSAPSGGSDATPGTSTTVIQSEEAFDPLTGLYDMPLEGSHRPIGVMIANDAMAARPQVGIDQADLYIEGETEGGITRIMAVFSCVDHMPEKLGPVRSARSPFVTLAQALDVVYCHAGGSVTALDTLKRIDIATVNALVYEGSTYWRDQQMREERDYEHSLVTGRDELADRIDSLGYRDYTNNGVPFTFGEKQGSGAGSRVQIDVSGLQTIHFVYDTETGVYTKYNGTFGDGEKHVAADGTPITVSNVAAIYADKFMENELTCDFDLSSGHGILVSGGTSRDIRYTCSPSGLRLTETDGTALQMATGKTYLCFVNSQLESGLVVE